MIFTDYTKSKDIVYLYIVLTLLQAVKNIYYVKYVI